MKHLLTILAALFLCSAPLHAQTLKSLMFNSTNGQVVANTGTNVLTFTNFFKIGGDTVLSDGQISWGGGVVIDIEQQYLANGNWTVLGALLFNNTTNAATTRTNLGLPLAALTNTSNVTAMRALGGSTNTNEPYSGTVALTNTNVLTFSNGVLLRIQ